MSKMSSESGAPIGWMVHRFGDINIGRFGVKIVEDVIKFVSKRVIEV